MTAYTSKNSYPMETYNYIQVNADRVLSDLYPQSAKIYDWTGIGSLSDTPDILYFLLYLIQS